MKRAKLGRDAGHRRAMLRNLVAAVLLEESIQTTDAKAKAVRPIVDEMITLGKQGDLHARRQAAAYLVQPEAVQSFSPTLLLDIVNVMVDTPGSLRWDPGEETVLL